MRVLLMFDRGVFHDGELAVQRRAGVASQAAKIGGSIHPMMPDAARAFISQRSWLVAATIDRHSRTRATVVWGEPGFAAATDAETIVLRPDLRARRRLDASLGDDDRIGLLAIDLASRRRMRANGRIVEQARDRLVLAVEEAFGNCKKYIQLRVPAAPGDPPDDDASERRSALSTGDRDRIERADTFFIATRHERGCDASHRGGESGFVRVIDERRIAWPDYTGNRMFQTLGNVAVDPSATLLFVDFETGDVLEVLGRAEIDWSDVAVAAMPGAERIVGLAIDEVRLSPGAFPLRKRLVERSSHNPPIDAFSRP